MASLKRYKQPQDLPPRFKRQKSFTSKTQTMEPADQNNSPVQKNKGTWGDSLNPSWSTTPHQKGSSFPREGRKIVKKLFTQKAQANAENTLLKPPTQPFVLSPMENKLFSLMRNDESNNPDVSSTVHPNYNSNTDHMLGLHTLTPMNQQSGPVSESFQGQVHNPPNLNSNPWSRESPASKQFKSNRQSQQVSPNSAFGQQVEQVQSDIRTIEMLRELERVADQTDIGNDENSNDKNSLVSHHLRMLMCAVDRYTQGVDEDESDSCSDESSPSEIIQHTPVKEKSHFNHNDRPGNNNNAPASFTSDFLFAGPGCFPTTTVQPPVTNTNSFNFNMGNKLLDPWSPWSSPGFNGLDVYASPATTNSHNYMPMNDPSLFMFDYQNMMSYSRDSCYDSCY